MRKDFRWQELISKVTNQDWEKAIPESRGDSRLLRNVLMFGVPISGKQVAIDYQIACKKGQFV
jgi:hypothetical protein